MIPIRKGFLWFLVLVNAVVLTAALIFFNSRKIIVYASPASTELPLYGNVADFSLTTQDGTVLRLGDLKEKAWVASFMFTRCAGQCPAINLKLSGLQKILSGSIRLVSFTTDPDNDTPESLSTYAADYHAEKERWIFLTGEKNELNAVLESFHLNKLGDPNIHSLRFALVDAQGRIRGYYDSSDEAELAKLVRDAANLQEGSRR